MSQILNFGLPAPIDVQISGPIRRDRTSNYADRAADRAGAVRRARRGRRARRTRSSTRRGSWSTPTGRSPSRAVCTKQNVANSLSISLAGSGTATTNFWLNSKNGVQLPGRRCRRRSTGSARWTSCTACRSPGGPGRSRSCSSNLATFSRTTTPLSLNHYNVQPVFDVLANVQGTDLGTRRRTRSTGSSPGTGRQISKASTITVRGQVQSMKQAFLGDGVSASSSRCCFVYLLMVVNFQSWLDPFIILMALPGALAGILWMLFVTGTTISVPSLMGASWRSASPPRTAS